MDSDMMALRRLAVVSGHLQRQGISTRLCSSDSKMSAAEVLATRRHVNVLDSTMSYLDTGGSKQVVLFLHGNPTSAYLWRNVIPEVVPIARCLAPDLIGMGRSGKNPTGSYRFVDHYRYLSAWIDKMNFPGKISLVVHDWGSGLGFHWANEHRDRVKAIVHMESLVGPVPDWNRFPDIARKTFQNLRSPGGEEMVLKKNFFVERLLPGAIMRKLSDEEMNWYREPYLQEGESRRPTLTWPREIPVASDGPEDVVRFSLAYNKWLKEPSLPKLYIHGDPGFFSQGLLRGMKDWQNQKVVTVKGLHFLQEDSPVEIGKATREFLSGL